MPPAKKAAANALPATAIEVEALRHPADVTRANIPTSETSSLVAAEEAAARPMRYKRDPDLDPQLVWRGKDAQDDEDLTVPTVPIYIQEKVLPEALIRDLRRQSRQGAVPQANLFGDFDRIADPQAKLEFYVHAENWSNRMILGDSLLVMNSLAEKEGLRGQVQMIYLDPPYGIRFGSNWQPTTKKRQVQDGKLDDISREPEQVKAFRDTWKDGVHSYLSYLRDRLIVARELLKDTGSIFVQIGDENVHVVRALLDEVVGPGNSLSIITIQKTGAQPGEMIGNVADFILWYARDKAAAIAAKAVRPLYSLMTQGVGAGSGERYDQRDEDGRWYQLTALTSAKPPGYFRFPFQGRCFEPGTRFWTYGRRGMVRLARAGRIRAPGRTVRFIRYLDDFAANQLTNIWNDTAGSGDKIYVVQTSPLVVERCLLMSTNPGDLVLDPTCGAGTTGFLAEQWGRRWITIDTSRVALALARTRLMAARFPAYLLRDSKEGALKEAEVSGRPLEAGPFLRDIRQGFVLERIAPG
jgi:adenine-specific DNA-methyltransferase